MLSVLELVRSKGCVQTKECLGPGTAFTTIKPNCLHLKAAEGGLIAENFPNCLQVPALQPWPPCLAGELFQWVKLNEVGSQRKDDFNKHRLALPQNGVAGDRLLSSGDTDLLC